MSGDIVTRLEVLAEKLLAQWPEPDDPYNPRVVFDAIKEIERLRAAIDALLTDIDGDHRPEWAGGAKATGKQPWCCGWCGAADGGWPCIHRRALNELKEARHGQ